MLAKANGRERALGDYVQVTEASLWVVNSEDIFTGRKEVNWSYTRRGRLESHLKFRGGEDVGKMSLNSPRRTRRLLTRVALLT